MRDIELQFMLGRKGKASTRSKAGKGRRKSVQEKSMLMENFPNRGTGKNRSAAATRAIPFKTVRRSLPAGTEEKAGGFTLVELLVVIGIIALLIGILLPALAKARDQARTVACQSNMRQFYNLMMLYAADYHQAVLPARYTVTSAEYYWWSPALLGNELRQTNISSDAARNLAEQVIARILTCPSAEHSLDLGASAGTNYQGDYTYNQNLGCVDLTQADPTTVSQYTPFERLTSVPGNVLVMSDMDKAYAESVQTSQANVASEMSKISIFLETNYLLGNHSTWPTQPPSMWIPHVGGTKANMLFMDGHISRVAPNDFVVPGTGGSINTKQIPWIYTPGPSTIQTKDFIIGYYKAANDPLWVHPWQRGVPGL